MRQSFLTGAAFALALSAASAPCAFANEFQDLRRSEPAVERVLAALPSGAVAGTLQRLSSLAEASASSQSERQTLAAIERLEQQLRAGLPSLDLRDRLVLAQIVRAVVIDDLLRAQGGSSSAPAPCPAGTSAWGAECHAPIERALDDIAALLESSIRQGFDALRAADPSVASETLPPTPSGGIDAGNFGDWLDEVLDEQRVVDGVEQIDL